MQLSSRTYDADNIAAVQELYHSNGWTDGLPIVPPTADAVQACLDWAMMPPDQLIGIEPVRGLSVTAEKLAINAVMAGCLPMHFPVVLTAWTAFKVLIAGGGAERALRSGIVTLLIAAIALAALANPGATWSLFAVLGGSIFSAVREAVQTAVAPPAV